MAEEPTAVDRDRFKAARARGEARAQDASALVDAHDDRTSDAVFLIFRGGGSMMIRRQAIPADIGGFPTSAWSELAADAGRGTRSLTG